MTDRLDDKIRAFVLELVDDPPVAPDVNFETAKHTSPSQLRQMPKQRSEAVPVAAIVGAALLILIAVGLPVLLFSGGSEVVDEPTTTLATATTTTPPTTIAPPNPLSLPDAWQRVGASVMTPVVGLFNMTETTTGLVAVGFDPGEDDSRQNGVILRSADGVTWNRLGEDDPALNLGAVMMYGVTEGGPGLVAVGMGCEDDTEACAAYATVWTSSDGASWERSSANPEVFGERGALLDVVATQHGLIAAGGLYTTDGETELIQPTVWLSVDGIEWERVWQGDAYDYSAATTVTGFQALSTDTNGRVVGVGTAVNSQGDFVGAVWMSTDGRNWQRIDPNSGVFASNTGSDVSVLDVAAGPGGIVAVGSDGGAEVAVWHSPDGLSWTRAETADQPFEQIGSLGTVDALGSGWITAGPHGFVDMTGGTVTLWTSPDGVNWDRVHSIDPGYAMSIVATDSGIAVAGGMAGLDDYYAAVWAGPAFDPSAPPPDPGPAPSPIKGALPIPDEGLSCEELAEAGYSYIATVAYWQQYGRAVEFDRDADGVPCEAAFNANERDEVFPMPEAPSVFITTLLNDLSGTFVASGDAVEAGLICSTGTTEFLGDPEPDEAALFRWEDLYTCDDGSGTFVLGADVVFVDGNREYGVWNIERGTGNYESLHAGGGSNTLIGLSDSLVGKAWLATGEN